MNKIKIDKPIIVEGKYDKIKLSSIVDAKIITTDGFGIFKKDEKLNLIRRLAEKNGIIVLTDSDGAGLVIRNYFNSVLPKNRVTHIYTPEIMGKERRKKISSKEGFLGVEGIEADELRRIFMPLEACYENSADCSTDGNYEKKFIGKTDLYEYGFSGREDSAEKREKLARGLGFPHNISSNALLEAMNMLYGYDECIKILEENEKK